MERWNGRVALVTGASAGVGAAICKALVKHGMKVVGAARRVERIQELAKELSSESGSLMAVRCDLQKDEDIYELFSVIKKTFGGVDICINNAGMSFNHNLLDGNAEDWRAMMDVNVIAACLCTKLSVTSMRERNVDDGHVLFINSDSGFRVDPAPLDTIHFYCGTKFALRGIAEGWRQEFRELKSHLRVSSVSPGFIETEFFDAMLKDPVEAKKVLASLIPLKAEDIASSVIHVVSAPPHVEINDVVIRPTEQKE